MSIGVAPKYDAIPFNCQSPKANSAALPQLRKDGSTYTKLPTKVCLRSRSASPLSLLKLNGSLVVLVNEVSATSEIACPQVYAAWNARRFVKRRLSHNCSA